MKKIHLILSKLLNDLISFKEEGMQRTVLASRLKNLDAHEIARLLDALYEESAAGSAVRKLKSILVSPDVLEEILGRERYKLAYLAAIDMGFKKVSRLFTNLPPHKKDISGYDKEEEAKMEFISLGQRRALAKAHIKDTLDRLLSDPDPVVITNLLSNPRMTEREVVKIASKRPNSPHILKLLATHKKWSKRYAVIKALVFNPYSPPRIATGLMEFLLSQDLKLVSTDRTLHPQVRMGAKEIIWAKKGGTLE